jgi:hypothetical protein
VDIELAKSFADTLQRISKNVREHPWFGLSLAQVTFSHAITSVRTNGSGRLNSLLDVIKQLEDLMNDLELTKACLWSSLADGKLLISHFYENYQLCEFCKGEYGEQIKSDPHANLIKSRWVDCSACKGLGFVAKV